MARFILKAGIIEAVQYRREENITEVQYFFDQAKDQRQKFRYQEVLNEYAVVLFSAEEGYYLRILKVGEYIIRHVNGSYEVLSEKQMTDRYERVTC